MYINLLYFVYIYIYILSVNLLILFPKDALPLVHLGQTFLRSDGRSFKFIFFIFCSAIGCVWGWLDI